MEFIVRIIFIFAIIGLAVIVIINPIDKLRKVFIDLHERVLIFIGLVILGWEAFEFTYGLTVLEKHFGELFVNHLKWGVLFFALLCVELLVFKKFIEPKLKAKREKVAESEKLLKVFTSVPRRVEFFTGRKEEIGHVSAFLNENRQVGIVGLVGMGGIGKTAIAKELCYRMKGHFSDGIVWLTAGSSSVETIIDTIASLLGWEEIPKLLPHLKTSQLQLCLSDKKILVVLDDAQDGKVLSELLEILSTTAILVTSRKQYSIVNLHLLPLNKLKRDDAIALFQKKAGMEKISDKDISIIDEICNYLGGLPLAIILSASRKKELKNSLEHVFEDLQKHGLDTLATPLGEDDTPGVRCSFDISFHFLGETDKVLFATLGAFGGDTFNLEAVASITQLSDCKKRLHYLAALSMVEVPSEDRYNLHPLLRLYAQEKLNGGADTVFDKVVDYYLGLIQKESNHLETELSNVFSAMDWCYKDGKWKRVIDFMWAMDGFLDFNGYWSSRRSRLKMAIKASEEGKNDLTTKFFKHELGIVTMNQGDLDEAKELFENTLEINKRLEDKDGIWLSLQSQGRVAEAQDNYKEAKKLYKDALDIAKRLMNKSYMADTLHESGVVEYRLGKYKEAKRLYEEALKLEKEINYESTMSYTLHALALLFQADDYEEKDYSKAERLYNESLRIKRKLNNKDEIARTLYQLADLYKDEKRYKQALPLCQECVEIFKKLGHRYLGQAQGLLSNIKQRL